MAMYIRVKRNKTTYFVQCDPTETILDIKQKLHFLIDHPVKNQRLILASTNEVLDDSKILADQKVENDAVVALALKKKLIVRHSDLFYSCRAQFVSQMVKSVSRLGLPYNTTAEDKRLVIGLAGLVVAWENQR